MMCRRIRQLVMPGYLSAACSSLVLGALMMFALAGCVAKNETDDTSRADAVPEHESWYGVFQGSAKTGFATTQRRRIEEHGESLVEIRKTLVIQGPKGNDVPQARFEMTFVETPNGDLRRFIRTAATGGKHTTTACRVKGSVLEIEDPMAGNRNLAWSPDFRSPNAWERILAENPPAVDETRRFRALDDSFLAVLPQELTGKGEVTAGTGKEGQIVRKYEHRITLADGQSLVKEVWIDATGDCVREALPSADLEMRKMSREAALSPGADPIDLVYDMMVRLDKPFAGARQSVWTKYRVQLANKQSTASFAMGANQAVQQIDAQTLDVVVRAINPTGALSSEAQGVKFDSDNPPDAASRTPNHFISSADPGVIRIAESAAIHESDQFRIAVALERRVHEHIAQFDYSQAFLTAAETAAGGRGDCSEVAVLLAAVLRARGIPSQVAVGLVYVDDPAALGYHMWTEAWINNRWLPFDAVFPQGGCAADRIKVASTNLGQGFADAALIKLSQLLGARPKIAVLESHANGS